MLVELCVCLSKTCYSCLSGSPMQIVRRYDLVFIQEIRDISQTVIHEFLEVVNG